MQEDLRQIAALPVDKANRLLLTAGTYARRGLYTDAIASYDEALPVTSAPWLSPPARPPCRREGARSRWARKDSDQVIHFADEVTPSANERTCNSDELTPSADERTCNLDEVTPSADEVICNSDERTCKPGQVTRPANEVAHSADEETPNSGEAISNSDEVMRNSDEVTCNPNHASGSTAELLDSGA
ncbi:MAG TPA: hypothetical protein VIA62_18765 [Thermoanaerobaculia bacterium]|nr:hypothetical protein [Thermoanaerobaculia bacterium]